MRRIKMHHGVAIAALVAMATLSAPASSDYVKKSSLITICYQTATPPALTLALAVDMKSDTVHGLAADVFSPFTSVVEGTRENFWVQNFIKEKLTITGYPGIRGTGPQMAPNLNGTLITEPDWRKGVLQVAISTNPNTPLGQKMNFDVYQVPCGINNK